MFMQASGTCKTCMYHPSSACCTGSIRCPPHAPQPDTLLQNCWQLQLPGTPASTSSGLSPFWSCCTQPMRPYRCLCPLAGHTCSTTAHHCHPGRASEHTLTHSPPGAYTVLQMGHPPPCPTGSPTFHPATSPAAGVTAACWRPHLHHIPPHQPLPPTSATHQPAAHLLSTRPGRATQRRRRSSTP